MVEKSLWTFLVCFITFCGQPFEVIDATSQKYTAGRKESGGGVNYEITVVAKKSSKKLSLITIVV